MLANRDAIAQHKSLTKAEAAPSLLGTSGMLRKVADMLAGFDTARACVSRVPLCRQDVSQSPKKHKETSENTITAMGNLVVCTMLSPPPRHTKEQIPLIKYGSSKELMNKSTSAFVTFGLSRLGH